MHSAANVPPELLERINALRPILEVSGSIGLHRRTYRLRYRTEADDGAGYRVYRSLLLGDSHVADTVFALITGWRAARQGQEAEAKKKAQAEQLAKQEQRLRERLFVALNGGGHRRKRQIREWYRAMQTDLRAAVMFAVTGDVPAPRKAGRPRKKVWDGECPGFTSKDRWPYFHDKRR